MEPPRARQELISAWSVLTKDDPTYAMPYDGIAPPHATIVAPPPSPRRRAWWRRVLFGCAPCGARFGALEDEESTEVVVA